MPIIQGEKQMSQNNPVHSLANVAASHSHATDKPSMPGTGIEARNIHAWFGNKHVIDDVSIDFIPTAAMAGEVLLEGKDIYEPGTDVTKIRLGVGMVFQKPNPFPSMTIKENVLSGLKLAQLKVSNQDELLESCLVRAGLWNEVKDRLNEYGGALSGGQQQRLCIARSLAVNPQVLLMDEPCSALDPGSTRRIEDTIREISSDMTVVIVTHNMAQAQRVSDYTAFFLSEDGAPAQVVENAKTEEIFKKPKDSRTNDYVNGLFG